MSSVLVWIASTAALLMIGTIGERLFEYVQDVGHVGGGAMLAATLLIAAWWRQWLHRRPGWAITSENSWDIALERYHGSASKTADPSCDGVWDDFALAGRKSVATIITIASGGAGGVAAPLVLVSVSIGSGVARCARLVRTADVQICQLAGIAAMAGTLLRTPFAATLFAMEVMYRDRIEYGKLSFCLIAAVIGSGLSTWLFGSHAAWRALIPSEPFGIVDILVATLVAIVVAGPMASLLIRALRVAQAFCEQFNERVRMLAGATCTATIAILLMVLFDVGPQFVLGLGHDSLAGLFAAGDARWASAGFVLLALIGRMLAVAFTIGGGGSVGLFAPAAFFGGASGALACHALNALEVFGTFDTTLFVILGIASALVVIIHVPLTAIALTIEVFGPSYAAPVVLTCAIAHALSRGEANGLFRPQAPK